MLLKTSPTLDLLEGHVTPVAYHSTTTKNLPLKVPSLVQRSEFGNTPRAIIRRFHIAWTENPRLSKTTGCRRFESETGLSFVVS